MNERAGGACSKPRAYTETQLALAGPDTPDFPSVLAAGAQRSAGGPMVGVFHHRAGGPAGRSEHPPEPGGRVLRQPQFHYLPDRQIDCLARVALID